MSRFRRVSAALCCGALLAAPGCALAQEFPFGQDFFRIEPQTYADVPNIPGPNGCVKWCIRDLSPCDPPLYKRADNRCSNISN